MSSFFYIIIYIKYFHTISNLNFSVKKFPGLLLIINLKNFSLTKSNSYVIIQIRIILKKEQPVFIEVKEIRKLLKQKRIKVTKPRVEILEYLMCNRVHPTAETVFTEVKKRLPEISRATIYNNLHFFEEQDLVKRYRLHDDVDIFDINIESHSHFVCKRCLKIFDLEYSVEVPQEIEGHKVNDLIVKFVGICKDCSGGEDE